MKSSEYIWREFHKQLLQFIQSRISNKQDAEDILQDVFVKIHKKKDQVSNTSSMRAWLYSVTRNTIIDFYRKRKDVQIAAEDFFDKIEANSNKEEESILPMSCIQIFVNQLEPKYKEAFTKVELEGMQQTDLAELLDISISGAKSRVQRSRMMIQNMLLHCCSLEKDQLGNITDFIPKNSCKESDC